MKNATIKNLHLSLSVLCIIPVALVYGLHPDKIFLELFDIKMDTVNLKNIFRAMMGLYLAFSSFWIIGIIKPRYWTTATLTNIVFMGGLAFGRLLSLALDGLPSIYFWVGLLVEVFFAVWGARNIGKY